MRVLLLASLLLCGCQQPTIEPARGSITTISQAALSSGIYDLEVDGEHYIIVNDTDSIAICPKTKPAIKAEKE